MALDFPDSPTVNEFFNGPGGHRWRWDGHKWIGLGGGADTAIHIGPTPPSSPLPGSLWWDTISGQMFIWYTDATSSQWVLCNVPEPGPPGPEGVEGPQGDKGDVGDTGGNAIIDVDPPVTSAEGTLWFDAGSAQLFVLYEGQWVVANSLPINRTGVVDGSDAAPGEVGEYIESYGLGSASITLTPGDWDVTGHFSIAPATGTLPRADCQFRRDGTLIAIVTGLNARTYLDISSTGGITQFNAPMPTMRLNLTASATIEITLAGTSGYSSTSGCWIRARRMR